MENNEQQIQTPQGTQLYKNIGDLMDIVAERYEKAPKAVRNLLMNVIYN